MDWITGAARKVPPVAAEVDDNLEYLKAQVDTLAGATAPTGTIARLGSAGAGSGYVMDGPYEKQSDGSWLWRPELHGGLLREEGVSASSIPWTVTDGLSRVVTKANWEFELTGSGTATIVLSTRFSNSATIATRTVQERVLYSFDIPSGLTITFQADTGITLRRTDGSVVGSFSQAGPARTRFLHGSSTWQEV